MHFMIQTCYVAHINNIIRISITQQCKIMHQDLLKGKYTDSVFFFLGRLTVKRSSDVAGVNLKGKSMTQDEFSSGWIH